MGHAIKKYYKKIILNIPDTLIRYENTNTSFDKDIEFKILVIFKFI